MAVVIPCFNMEATIARAVESVLGLEVIVVDDGSTDRSVEILRGFGEQVRVELGGHQGACHARNVGLRAATADYVLFLDADDYVHGDYAGQLAAAAGGADMVVGATSRLDEAGLAKPRTLGPAGGRAGFLADYIDRFLQTSGFMWRRAFVTAQGGWDESLPIFQDVEFALRMLLAGAVVVHAALDDAYAVWVQHDGAGRITNSMSRGKVAAMAEVLRTHEAGLLALGSEAVKSALARRFYWHAGVAFATGQADLGRDSLRAAKRLGVAGPAGSRVNRWATRVLGLEGKTRLALLGYRVTRRARPFPYNLAGR